MRLRSSRPPVTRLSRRVLLGLGIAAAIGICGALFLALRPAPRSTGSELYHTGDSATPDGLANLPRDYSGLPKAPALGAPLPGDLGRPIVQAGAPAPGPNPDQQRAQQEQEAALTSRLFATTAPSSVTASAAALPAIAAAAPTAATPAASPSGDATSQDHKLAFLNGNPDRHTVSAERVEPPPSPYVLQAGAVIAAALLTGIRSDLPGQVTAQVTEDVYDSPSGRFLLIPQGARLVGQYDAQVAFGQSRALVVWTRLIMPNGRSIVLEREPAADPQGYAGLEDEVDDHLGLLFKAAVLSTLLSVGAEAGESGNNQNAIAQAIRQGASQSINQTGAQVVGRSLNVQPTITIRPGFPVRVMVTRDLVLEPYRG
jgi:type IV secretion system protein VirB10